MMNESLKFQLELIDKMTKPGKEMAAQLQKLKLQLNAANQAVKQTEAALKKLQKAKVVDIAASKQLNEQLSHQKAAVAGYQSSILGLAGHMGSGAEEAHGYGDAIESLGPILKTFGAIYAAEAAVILGGAALAIHASELKQDTMDALDAFLDTAGASKDVYDRIEGMSSHIAISQKRGTDLARELSAAGVTNANALTNAIESIGMVESVLGAGAGSRIQGIIEKATAGGKFNLNAKALKGTGVQMSAIAGALGITQPQLEAQMKAGTITAEKGIAALTKAISSKFAGPAGKQVLDIGNQFQKFTDDVSKLFEDVDTSGFLSSLHYILSVFDQSTVAGKALKSVVTFTFDAIFKATEAVAPYVKAFFKGLVIIALQVYIALKPLLAQISGMGPASEGPAKLAGIMSWLGEVIGTMTSIIVGWIQTGVQIASWFINVEEHMWNLAAAALNVGAAIVEGLIGGLNPTKFIDAIKNMAEQGLGAFKSIFGIHSPSKVMAQMGGHLMGGLEQGIDKGSAGPSDAMSDAAAPPQVKGGSGGGGGSKSISVTVAPGAIVISGVQNAQQVADMLPEMLANVMEQLMLEQGSQAA